MVPLVNNEMTIVLMWTSPSLEFMELPPNSLHICSHVLFTAATRHWAAEGLSPFYR